MLTVEGRKTHIDFHFLAKDFRAQLILEAACVGLFAYRAMQVLRVSRHLHTIMLVLETSAFLVVVGQCLLLLFVFTGVPYAKANWGAYMSDWKTFGHAILSLLMVKNSKGNFSGLDTYSKTGSTTLIVIYFFFVNILLHAYFFKAQTNAIKIINR